MIEKSYQMNQEEYLQKIVRHLIINSSFCPSLGLYHGKMGIIIALLHYARYTNNSIYTDFAWGLLNEVFDEIHLVDSVSLESGYSGIGWALVYIIKNNFLTGDPDFILSEIDKIVNNVDLDKIDDSSVEKGLPGLLCYIKARKEGGKVFSDISWSDSVIIPSDRDLLLGIIRNNNVGYDYPNTSLGLSDGCSGVILKTLLV